MDDCVLEDNHRGAKVEGGAVAEITNTVFHGNTAQHRSVPPEEVSYMNGGGLAVSNSARAVVSNCYFVGNAGVEGGAVHILEAGEGTKIVNCVFAENNGEINELGGGVFVRQTLLDIYNCTFNNNMADYPSGHALFAWDQSDVLLKNCIVWGAIGSQLEAGATSTIVRDHSCVKGENCFDAGDPAVAPSFVDPTDPLNDGLRLLSGTSCIDNGEDPGSVFVVVDDEGLPIDLAGDSRIQGPGIDRGSYEQ